MNQNLAQVLLHVQFTTITIYVFLCTTGELLGWPSQNKQSWCCRHVPF